MVALTAQRWGPARPYQGTAKVRYVPENCRALELSNVTAEVAALSSVREKISMSIGMRKDGPSSTRGVF